MESRKQNPRDSRIKINTASPGEVSDRVATPSRASPTRGAQTGAKTMPRGPFVGFLELGKQRSAWLSKISGGRFPTAAPSGAQANPPRGAHGHT